MAGCHVFALHIYRRLLVASGLVANADGGAGHCSSPATETTATAVPALYANLVYSRLARFFGGNGDLYFDGVSVGVLKQGKIHRDPGAFINTDF